MRKFVFFFLVVLFALPAAAQQSVAEAATLARTNRQAAAELATREQVLTLLETLQVRKTMTLMLEKMKPIPAPNNWPR